MSFTALFAGGYTFGSAASGTAITFTIGGSTAAIGDVVCIGWCANVAGLTATCTDNASVGGSANVYTVRTPLAANTLTGGTIWCKLTRALATGVVITVTISSAATRLGGVCVAYHPSNANPVLDKTGLVQNATTSPVTCGGTGALAAADDVGVAFEFWKGGAVASGWANSAPASWTQIGPGASGGTTTRVEATGGQLANVGSATGFSRQCTFTSISAACSEVLTFSDLPLAGYAPSVTQQSAGGYDQPRRYDPTRSRVSFAFSQPTLIDGIAAVAASRPVKTYRGSYSLNASAGDQQFDQYSPGQVPDRQTPYYRAPLSQTIQAYDAPAVISQVYASVTQGYRPPFSYKGSPSQTIPVFDPATNTFHDWAPTALLSRTEPNYAPPRSQSIPGFFQPAAAFGSDYVASVISRAVANYRGSYSAFMGAADQAIATDSYASVAQSRQVAYYEGSAWYIAAAADEAIPDSYAAVFQSRQGLNYRPPLSQWFGALASPIVADTYAAVFQSRQVVSYESPLSRWVGTIASIPDAYAMVVQSRRALGYSAPLSRWIGVADNPAPPAPGYVAVIRSRGTLNYAARASMVIVPPLVVVTPDVQMGGGGEWIIWVKPEFPANDPQNWRRFDKMSFRKPTRRVP